MIRTFTKDDIDYVIESHCRIYKSENNFDSSFDELIIDSIKSFIKTKNVEQENIWVVDIDDHLKGSIGIVKLSNESAQLRWFLLEPDIRGKGYGKQLIQVAIDFCKANNYKTIFLWTNESLSTARNLYKGFGFSISERRKQFLSKQEIIEERWELSL